MDKYSNVTMFMKSKSSEKVFKKTMHARVCRQISLGDFFLVCSDFESIIGKRNTKSSWQITLCLVRCRTRIE